MILLLAPPRVAPGTVPRPGVVLLAVALAAASYRWLEQPIRRSRVSPGDGRQASPATLAACALVLTWSTARPDERMAVVSVVTLPPRRLHRRPATVALDRRSSTVGPSYSSGVAHFTATRSPPAGARCSSSVTAPRCSSRATSCRTGGQRPDELVVRRAAFPGCGLTAADDGRLHEQLQPRRQRQLNDLSGCMHQWTPSPSG